MTESGKTTLAKTLASRYQKAGFTCIVLDAIGDNWPTEYVYNDKDLFLDVVKRSRRCMVFIDEAGEAVGRYDSEMFWLATRGRHYGHSVHFITQRGQQLSPTVRGQAGYLALFNCSSTDARLLGDEWNREELRNAHQLARGEYFWTPRFGSIKKLRLWEE